MAYRHCFAALVVLAFCAAVAACGRGAESEAPAESAAQTATETAAPTAANFDIANVPLSAVALPPFPYLDWLDAVPEDDRKISREKNFDAFTVIAGRQFLEVEGRIEQREFSIPESMSQLEVRRNYSSRIQELGGVKVNDLNPVNVDNATIRKEVRELAGDGADAARILGLERYDEGNYEYEVYAIRTADTTAWIVVQTSQYAAIVTTIAHQEMKQSVAGRAQNRRVELVKA